MYQGLGLERSGVLRPRTGWAWRRQGWFHPEGPWSGVWKDDLGVHHAPVVKTFSFVTF